jgi:hypothetical protein
MIMARSNTASGDTVSLQYSVIAVMEIAELNRSFPMVQFLSRNIDANKSYGQNTTDQ